MRSSGGPKMCTSQWINVSAMACAVLYFTDIAIIKLVILQEVTKRYLKQSDPFGMNFLSTDKPSFSEQSTDILG